LKIDQKSAFDQFLEIIGRRKHLLKEGEYPTLFHKHYIKKDMASIGPCFIMLSDLTSMKFLEVSEGSIEVIGYTPKEIFQAGANFTFQIVHPQDLEHCLQMIKIAWEFVKEIPQELKLQYTSNFYYRAIKKDGTVIKVQLQVLNIETDIGGNLTVTCNILTDISHLGLSDEVKLTIVDSINNSCFSATGHHPRLLNESRILSKREIEILKLLVQGLNSRQIAERLIISYYTVRTHRKNILEKLGKKNTAELISYALYNSLI
jgi:DNA-binding CsgD family transcriptional regulator